MAKEYPMIMEAASEGMTDVMGDAMLLSGPAPKELGLEAWLFCLHCSKEQDEKHVLLALRTLSNRSSDMTHVISLIGLKEPFLHVPFFLWQSLLQAMKRPLISFQFALEGSDQALRQLLKELAEDIISGTLPVELAADGDASVWQEYIDYYTNKYSKRDDS